MKLAAVVPLLVVVYAVALELVPWTDVLPAVAASIAAVLAALRIWPVAVCTADDAVLRPLLERHKGCEVWVYPARQVAHGAGVRGQDCI